MLENYLDKMDITLEDMKAYINAIDPEHDEKIDYCFNIKMIKSSIYDQYDHYLQLGISHLYEVNDYEKMENDLVMMNYFFHDDEAFISVKKAMKKLILGLRNKIALYRLLRHIVDLDKKTLIHTLYQKGYISLEQAAYFSLVEDETAEAYHYLEAMPSVKDSLLAFYASYDLFGALKLQRHQHKSMALAYA